MDRKAILHVLRAAHDITKRKEFVLVGSGAVVAYLGEAGLSEGMRSTVDIDLYALDARDPEAFSDELEQIGVDSQFHATFGYHADGVSPKTAVMPADWRGRARQVDVPSRDGVTVLIPDPNDIAVAKLYAWREKDKEWLLDGLGLHIIDQVAIRTRLSSVIRADRVPDLNELNRRLDFLTGATG